LVVKVLGPVNVMLQRSPHSRPFCTHIDKVKPYLGDELPKNWLTSEQEHREQREKDAELTGETNDALVQQQQSAEQAVRKCE